MTFEQETLIFVDVDGVLNVGILDPASPRPVDLSTENKKVAEKCKDSHDKGMVAMSMMIEEVWGRAVLGADAQGAPKECYSKFESGRNCLSDVLVKHLADVILAAGRENCRVVLSSIWRLPRMSSKARDVEVSLSAHLGYDFKFHDRTSLREETLPEERLVTIGDYIQEYVSKKKMEKDCKVQDLRLLVLDDFSVGQGDRWQQLSDGAMVRNIPEAEQYLVRRCGGLKANQVKIVHTYDEWQSSCIEDLKICIGCGLTKLHTKQACEFVVPRSSQWASLMSLFTI